MPRTAVMAFAAALLGACGSGSANPVAEPESAPLATPPAGLVVAVGNKPEGIAYDPESGVLAVGLRAPDAVLLLDRDGHVLRRVDVSAAPRHLRFAMPGGPLLVPAEKSGELDLIGIPAGEIVGRIRVGRQPHDAVQVGGRIFVTNEFSDTVSVVDGSDVIANLPAPSQPGGIAATSSHLCVVGVRSHELWLLDARSLQKVAGAAAGAGPTHAVADADTCYIVDTTGGAVLAFRTLPTLKLAFKTRVGGAPYGIAVDPGRMRLWVTETATNSLAELLLDEAGPKLVARFPSVRQPNSVAVDPETDRVFVTGAGDGVIQILDPPA
jgi:YVTN family beta-propeller protein